jgi:hypothetical protein
MSKCANIQFISQNEYIGDSLPKINTNFQLLTGVACNLQNLLDERVNIRTFFYYGPNTPIGTVEEFNINDSNFEQQNVEARPSYATIQRFINTEINLPTISENGDIAWVIYQRTGWRNLTQEYTRSGSGSIPFTIIEAKTVTVQVPVVEAISIGRRGQVVGYTNRTEIRYEPVTYNAPYSWSVSLADQYRNYAPVFVIYKLKYNGTTYTALSNEGFPKYTRGATASTLNWNQPQLWNTY